MGCIHKFSKILSDAIALLLGYFLRAETGIGRTRRLIYPVEVSLSLVILRFYFPSLVFFAPKYGNFPVVPVR
jgi:hypothetical protein